MSSTSTADELRHAALLLRNPIRRPELCAVVDLPFTEPLADWLEAEAQQEAYTLAERGHHSASPYALAIARQINGSGGRT
ncbi:hypothetical protein [Streptomyces sp. JB150]|uniref:hypothetical protein n=1 Tax=Streptomyces sp. JB150 TaxID=2714844 RepID=UPI001409916C|nr:hypothetical protein [Streptomyces sp. JB150]QIJ62580.1 hypothetical protein G7Z13_11430 [Streptomyces sp. JB150]